MNDCEVLRYDYEIVRGVECCFRDQVECDNCPYKGIENCEAILKGEVATFLESKLETIDYILEQWNNAEKEIKGLKKSNRNWRRKVQRLRAENKLLIDNDVSNKYPICVLVEKGRIYTRTLEDYENLIGDISAEAYKECIKKVKENSKKTEIVCSGALITTNYAISAKSLNKLLKELIGE